MAVSATRTVTITLTGDVIATNAFNAAVNGASPGSETIHTLALGDNTIMVPTGGSTVKGATIRPPAGNAQTIILKGAGADTGISLSKLDPTSISFEAAPASFILNAGGVITGLRVMWT